MASLSRSPCPERGILGARALWGELAAGERGGGGGELPGPEGPLHTGCLPGTPSSRRRESGTERNRRGCVRSAGRAQAGASLLVGPPSDCGTGGETQAPGQPHQVSAGGRVGLSFPCVDPQEAGLRPLPNKPRAEAKAAQPGVLAPRVHPPGCSPAVHLSSLSLCAL